MNKLFLDRYMKDNFKKYNKTWDKSDYIKAHRILWLSISHEISVLKNSVISYTIKESIVTRLWGVDLPNYCFMCALVDTCVECPICHNLIWEGCLDGLYEKFCSSYDWKKQAKLAYKIAMLPEVR